MRFSLESVIKRSVFETHQFLIENESTSFIEYAAFCGSIQIFKYLILNKIELKPSLWLYVIHSKNPEMIHTLEELNIETPDSFKLCLFESIKCNHNDFANYIQNNLLLKNQINLNDMKDDVVEYAFRYCNYSYLPNDYDSTKFFCLCYYKYSKFAKSIIEKKKNEFQRGRSYINDELRAAGNSNDVEKLYFLLNNETKNSY